MSQPIRLKDHEKDARLVRGRVVVGAIVVVVLICVLLARLYFLQVVQYEYHSTFAPDHAPRNGRAATRFSGRPYL